MLGGWLNRFGAVIGLALFGVAAVIGVAVTSDLSTAAVAAAVLLGCAGFAALLIVSAAKTNEAAYEAAEAPEKPSRLGDRFKRLARRIADGEYGRGLPAVAKLLSLVLARELLTVAIGIIPWLVILALVFLIGYGLDASGHGDVRGNIALMAALAIIVFILARFKSMRAPILLYFLIVFSLMAIVIALDHNVPKTPKVAASPAP